MEENKFKAIFMEQVVAELTRENEGYYLKYEGKTIATSRPLTNADEQLASIDEEVCNSFLMDLFSTIKVNIVMNTVFIWDTHGHKNDYYWTNDGGKLEPRVEDDGFLHVGILGKNDE